MSFQSSIEVKGLTAGYGRSLVIHDVSLSLDTNEVSIVLGPNGAGKTTLLLAICGAIAAKGSVVISGDVVTGRNWTPQGMLKLGVAVVPSGRGTFRDLTVYENLLAGGLLLSRKEARSEADRWIEEFPRLAERRNQRAGLMSGGEQQMLAIARALMSRPTFLLLDEPSVGLAPIIVEQVYEILGRLKSMGSFGMLIVEQSIAHATEIAKTAYLLDGGQIVSQGTTEEVVGDDETRRAYLGY